MTKIHDIWAHRMFNLVRISNFWSKSNPGTKKIIELKKSEQTFGARCQFFFTIFKISKKMNTKITEIHDILADRMFNLIRKPNFWSKSNPGSKKRIELNKSEQTLIFGQKKSICFLMFWLPLGSHRFSRLPRTQKK